MSSLWRLPVRWLVLLCALPFLFCAFFNFGFFASDEYWTGITRYIPAQTSSISGLIRDDDVKSPSQLLPFHGAAQLAYKLGMNEPFDQYRFTLTLLSLISTLLLFAAFTRLPFGPRDRRTAILLLGFHFATAIAFTRPMFESLSASFVALAAVAALWYDRKPRFHFLALGIAAASTAFLLRPQAGVIALVFLILPVWKRAWRDLAGAIAVGITAFVLAGLFDGLLMGEFHGSLRRVLVYNVEHGSDYGRQSIFFYLPLLFILALGPWTMWSFASKRVLRSLRRQRAVLWMLALFVLEHSLFPHKFERFLIPVLPLILMLITPAVTDLFSAGRAGAFRRISLILVNLLLAASAIFFEPQGPMLDLVRFANAHPEVRSFVNADEALSWYPDIFQNRPVGVRPISLGEPQTLECDEVLVARQHVADGLLSANAGLEVRARIRPGPIDALAYRLNPEHNIRRAPLVLLGCAAGTNSIPILPPDKL